MAEDVQGKNEVKRTEGEIGNILAGSALGIGSVVLGAWLTPAEYRTKFLAISGSVLGICFVPRFARLLCNLYELTRDNYGKMTTGQKAVFLALLSAQVIPYPTLMFYYFMKQFEDEGFTHEKTACDF